jgi:PTS system mannose-specific IID component
VRVFAPALSLSVGDHVVPRHALAAVFVRAFAVQGSWNYKTLIGAGFAFSMLPALRAIHRGDDAALNAALQRHVHLFNSHPYLAPMALGAVIRLEEDRENPAVIERFKAAVRGSLGTMGDRLVWAGLRPASLLAALVLLFIGVPWWLSVGVFLVTYNAAHLALRVWSFRLGLREGKSVGEQLRRHPIGDAQRFLSAAGAFLAGAALPLLSAGGVVAAGLPIWWLLFGAIAGVIGVRFGPSIRTPLILLLAAFYVVGLFLKIAQ